MTEKRYLELLVSQGIELSDKDISNIYDMNLKRSLTSLEFIVFIVKLEEIIGEEFAEENLVGEYVSYKTLKLDKFL